MRRRKKLGNLLTLYLNFVFQKSTIILFSISLLLMTLALFFIANPWLDIEKYKLEPMAFHLNYFQEALLVLEIFNTILVTTVVIVLILNSISFDSLFISYTKREVIAFAKVLSSFILFLLLSLFEFIILYLYPLLIYPDFKIEIRDLLTIGILFLSMGFTYSISLVVTTLIQTIFPPMLILFISLIKSVLVSSFSSVKNVLKELIPIPLFQDGYVIMNSIFVIPVFLFIFILIYIFLYNIKDIKIA